MHLLHPPFPGFRLSDATRYQIAEAHRSAFEALSRQWFNAASREMPWRDSKDPYRIWVSEIMLQQTRVDQARPYFERFMQAFPTVQALADAPLDDVLKAWEGLGYYSRARNLHRAARVVVDDFGGSIPDSYEQIRTLPGVGPYTAAAVLSIAFDKPYAVLDGNVARVLARVFAIREDIKSTPVRKLLQNLADELLDAQAPGRFNEAIMDLGATVCTPAAPQCFRCPLRPACGAFLQGNPDAYPVSAKKPPVPHYDVAVGIVRNRQGEILIQKRPEEGLLGGLWEFPGGKREEGESIEEACRRELQEELGIEVEISDLFHKLSHAYTHFRITLYAFRCSICAGVPDSAQGLSLRWVSLKGLEAYAFPRANRRLVERLVDMEKNPSLFDG